MKPVVSLVFDHRSYLYISGAHCPLTAGGPGQLEGILWYCEVQQIFFQFSSIKQCQDCKIEHILYTQMCSS